MGTVWFLSRPDRLVYTKQLLESNFGVRKVASVSSFAKLVRMERSSPPAVVVWDGELDDKLLWETLEAYCPRAGKIIVSDQPSKFKKAIVVGLDSRDVLFVIKDILSKPDLLSFRDLSLDPRKGRFKIDGFSSWEELSKKEFGLLECLINHTHSFLTLNDIKNKVWSGNAVSRTTIASQISRLRNKLSGSEVVIESKYGEGYRLS